MLIKNTTATRKSNKKFIKSIGKGQFRRTHIKVFLILKVFAGYILPVVQGFKNSNKCRPTRPTWLYL